MKKLFVLILAAAIMLSLTACDKADNDSESNTDIGGEISSSTSSESTPDVPEENEPEKLVQLTESEQPFNPYCFTEDGMYYVDSEPYSDRDFVHIMYIDFATKQETYLCSDSSCNHSNERCTSCIERSYLSGMRIGLFVYKEHLYLLSLYHIAEGGFNTRGEIGIGFGKQALYRMNLDGTKREMIYTPDSSLTFCSSVVGDGDNLWFCVHEEYIEESRLKGHYYIGGRNKALIKLDLSQLTIVEQIPISDKYSISKEFFLCSGNKFIFKGTVYPDGMTKKEFTETEYELSNNGDGYNLSEEVEELWDRCRYAYYTVNRDNKETKEIYRTETSSSGSAFMYNGELYLTCKNADDALDIGVRINVDTGEAEDFTAAEGYEMTSSMFGDKFACWSMEEETDDYYKVQYYVDAKTGEISKCELTEYPYNRSPLTPITVFGGKIFVKNGYKLIPSGNDDGQTKATYPEFAFVSFDDFFNSRPNYEPIKMLVKDKGAW